MILYDIDNKKIALSDIYHYNTQLNYININKLENEINTAITNKDFLTKIKDSSLLYENIKEITLPKPNRELEKYNLFDTILKRRSIRNYSEKPLLLEELSTILFYSTGISYKTKQTDYYPSINLRTYPSAGGIYPLKFYLYINNVIGLKKGIYYYNNTNNTLKCLNNYCNLNTIINVLKCDNYSIRGACSILMIGNMELMNYKYGERGYRFINIEAGHIAQNIYLVSTAMEIGALALGGFLDEDILKLLPLESKDIMFYQVVIGNINAK